MKTRTVAWFLSNDITLFSDFIALIIKFDMLFIKFDRIFIKFEHCFFASRGLHLRQNLPKGVFAKCVEIYWQFVTKQINWLYRTFVRHIEYVFLCHIIFNIFNEGINSMDDFKTKLVKLLSKLNSYQIEFLYHFACKLFGYTPD